MWGESGGGGEWWREWSWLVVVVVSFAVLTVVVAAGDWALRYKGAEPGPLAAQKPSKSAESRRNQESGIRRENQIQEGGIRERSRSRRIK